MLAVPILFIMMLSIFEPIVDNFLLSLVPNLYALAVVYFVLKKSNLGENMTIENSF